MCDCRLCQVLDTGQLTFPERGVVRVTWSSSEFYIPWNIFGTAKATDYEFCALSAKWAWSWPRGAFYNFTLPEICLERLKLQSSNFVCLPSMSNVSLRMADHLWKRRGTGHGIHFRILHPLYFYEMTEHRIVKFCARVGARSISRVMKSCPQAGVINVTWRLNFLVK